MIKKIVRTLLDNVTVKLQLKFQVDTCDSLRVPWSPDLKNAVSSKTRSKFYVLKMLLYLQSAMPAP